MKNIFSHGYTLPEYIKLRFGDKMQKTYMIVIFIIQIYSVILQITAAILLLNYITGIEKSLLTIILGLIILSLAIIKGFRSSLAIDIIKAMFIFLICLFIIPRVISETGGTLNLINGINQGLSILNIFDTKLILTFGIPISISLLSGVVIDQQQRQRAFAIKKNAVKKSFLFASFIFLLIPIFLGILGFVAKGLNMSVNSSETQLIGISLIGNYLPSIGIYLFSFMVLAGLVAAGVAALSAAGSIGTIDLLPMFKKNISEKRSINFSRIIMILVTILSIGIALIPNIQLLYLVLIIGVFRSALMIPTILSLYWNKISSKITLWGIVLGIIVGVPLFIYGSITKNMLISSLGSLIPITISSIFSIISGITNKKSFNYNILSNNEGLK
ncbi:MAG: hypothetical protein PHR61_04850 [Candidatus Absconditabacteria bacterium]|nr:hypothetical protein [Candidatus Absconditabacteria bacterium]